MITREVALHHSPTLWGLAAIGVASTVGAISIVAWNAWDRREQLVDRGIRLVDNLRGHTRP